MGIKRKKREAKRAERRNNESRGKSEMAVGWKKRT